jgi:hypothetical protein
MHSIFTYYISLKCILILFPFLHLNIQNSLLLSEFMVKVSKQILIVFMRANCPICLQLYISNDNFWIKIKNVLISISPFFHYFFSLLLSLRFKYSPQQFSLLCVYFCCYKIRKQVLFYKLFQLFIILYDRHDNKSFKELKVTFVT